jgi:hypothetical protein
MLIADRPCDASGYWHYVYVTYDPDTGEWYGGKHSTRNLNDGYLGSGNWVKYHPAREALIIEAVEFYDDEDGAYLGEAALVTTSEIMNDHLCRNECEGGNGLTADGARRIHAQESWKQGVKRGGKKRASDPAWRASVVTAMRRLAADPDFRKAQKLGCEGRGDSWRASVKKASRLTAQRPAWRANNAKHLKKAAQLRWGIPPQSDPRQTIISIFEEV